MSALQLFQTTSIPLLNRFGNRVHITQYMHQIRKGMLLRHMTSVAMSVNQMTSINLQFLSMQFTIFYRFYFY